MTIENKQKPMSDYRGPFQFTIRTWFTLLFMLSVPLAIYSCMTRPDRAIASARSRIHQLDGFLDKGNVNGTFYVALQGRYVSDEDFIPIAKDLRNFPGPWLDQSHTVVLDISSNPITDESVPFLVGINLESLSLANTQITDASVSYLERLPVRYLNVTGTRISQEGAERLRDNFRGHELKSDFDARASCFMGCDDG